MGEIIGVLVVVLLSEAGVAEPQGWPESCMTVFEEQWDYSVAREAYGVLSCSVF